MPATLFAVDLCVFALITPAVSQNWSGGSEGHLFVSDQFFHFFGQVFHLSYQMTHGMRYFLRHIIQNLAWSFIDYKGTVQMMKRAVVSNLMTCA